MKVRWLLLGGAAAVACVTVCAADLDELFRPLPAQGQSLWDAGVQVDHPWGKEVFTQYEVASYRSNTAYTPSAGVQTGLTDALRLSVSGDFMDNSWKLDSWNKDWSANLGLIWQASPGLRLQFGYRYERATSSDIEWEAWDPYFYARDQWAASRQTTALSVQWLTRPKPAYERLVPDLNGLIGPLLDPGQSLLEASVSVLHRGEDRQGIETDSPASKMVVRTHTGYTGPWTAQAQWTMGLPHAWEIKLSGITTTPYDQRGMGVWLYPPPVFSGPYRAHWPQTFDASVEADRRWGQSFQLGFGGEANWWQHESFLEDTRSAFVSAVFVSRPTRKGEPHGRNLDGLLLPMLDPGQVRWDGRLTARWYGWTGSQQWWEMDNTVTVGVARAVQFQALVNLTPDLEPGYGPRGDRWTHYVAGLGVVYRPCSRVEIRGAYRYAYDRSAGGHIEDTDLMHTFRLTASLLW